METILKIRLVDSNLMNMNTNSDERPLKYPIPQIHLPESYDSEDDEGYSTSKGTIQKNMWRNIKAAHQRLVDSVSEDHLENMNDENMRPENSTYKIFEVESEAKAYMTPMPILKEIMGMHSKQIESYQPSIREYISNFCREQSLPYTCTDSHLERKTSKYIKFNCRFYRKQQKCESFFFLKVNEQNRIEKIKAHWVHNHQVDQLYIRSYFNLLSNEEIELISFLRSTGATVGYIRRCLDLTTNPQTMYNVSRRGIKSLFEDEIIKLKEKCVKWSNNYEVSIKFSEEKTFEGITLINKRISGMAFSSDICILDDTMCTNRFSFPILPAFVIDENSEVQLLALGIITSKTEEGISEFFKDLSSKIPQIRVFIVDRLT